MGRAEVLSPKNKGYQLAALNEETTFPMSATEIEIMLRERKMFTGNTVKSVVSST